MNGTIKIKVKGTNIRVKGHLANATLVDQTAMVDALMNTFGMNGAVRESVCAALLYVDEKHSEEGVSQK